MNGEKTDGGPNELPPPYSSPQRTAEAAASADSSGWTGSAWTAAPPAYSADSKTTTNESFPPYPTQYATPYPYQQQQNVVIVQPAPMGPLQNPPEDYMCYSIFVTLCCCWLIGIFAIMRASECRAAIAAGDRVAAEIKSREARGRAHLALGLGIGTMIFTFVIIGVYLGVILNSYN